MSRYVTITRSMGADGLGVPSVSVYFSYCDKKVKCKGCHNPELWSDKVGYNISVNDAVDIIERKLSYLRSVFGSARLVLVGGEPLARKNRGFAQKLAKRVDAEVVVYTWRTKEDLRWINTEYYDYIVCGEYREDLKDENYELGSTNQYIINSNKEIIKQYEEVK